MSSGFVDGNGRKYNPSIVRVGSGQSDAVKGQVSLGKQVDGFYVDARDASVMEVRPEKPRVPEEITMRRYAHFC